MLNESPLPINIYLRVEKDEPDCDFITIVDDFNNQLQGFPHLPHIYMLETDIVSATIIGMNVNDQSH